jgi:hypothetical protein
VSLEETRTSLTISSTFADALRVYRLLFQRSVTAAAVVYGAIALIELARHSVSGAVAPVLGFVAFVATTAGPLLVQGALVEIVRNVHEGRAAEKIGVLFAISGERFWRLLGASIIYVCGVLIGLVLLIVPGVLTAARWCLLAPLVMLEGKTVGDSRFRSAELVKGHTGKVLVCVVLAYLIDASVVWGLLLSNVGFGTYTLLTFVWSALTAPLQAHVLTVLYYRLADPSRPIIAPTVLAWNSVWEGQ